jgi:hypothetical protein
MGSNSRAADSALQLLNWRRNSLLLRSLNCRYYGYKSHCSEQGTGRTTGFRFATKAACYTIGTETISRGILFILRLCHFRLNSSECIASNGWSISDCRVGRDVKGRGRGLIDRLRKTKYFRGDNRSLSRDMNPGPTEYEKVILTTRQSVCRCVECVFWILAIFQKYFFPTSEEEFPCLGLP